MSERDPAAFFPPQDFSIEENPEYTDELKRALRIGYHNKKGIALASQGALGAALVEFDAAIKDCPTFAEAWFHRGLVLGQQNQFDLAYQSFAQAAFLTPLYTSAVERLAALAPIVGRPAEILTPWAAKPPSALTREYHKIKQRFSAPEPFDKYEESGAATEEALRQALAVNPRAAGLADKLGLLLQTQFRMIEAEYFFRYALMIAPWMGRATVHLCTLLDLQHRSSDARGLAAAALQAGATDERLPCLALWSTLGTADWSNYEAWHRRTVAAMRKDARAGGGYDLWYVDDAELHYGGACAHSSVYENAIQPLKVDFRRSAERPITLGYVSADFRDHPVARLTAELFELHDRKRFRVYGYGLMSDPKSAIGLRIRKAFDKYADISSLSPRAGAQRIVDDRVDILIDLTGNMLFGPKSIIARRPAPIQVNYLGHPGTTGSRQMDYIIVDKIIVPRDQQKWFTEALVYLPECHQVNDRKRAVGDAPKSRGEYGLPPDGVVYCSFNETKKITPHMFDAWMRILARVPGSVLWLASQKKGTADNIRRRAAACGIDPDRVIFAERTPDHNDHMSRYRRCDLYLDTLLYNGHTTASDALWAGCPVLTTLGNTYQTRVAASLLHAMGLSDLVAPSPAAYEDLAVRIGHDADLRASLRKRVEANRATSVLFDTPRFTRHLEAAFERMWDAYVDGRPPVSFDVPPLPR
jgi:predicted O-linked N-acetylglucosamine transferase (SPINDLY family)